MYSEAEIKTFEKSRMRIMVRALIISLSAIICYFGLVSVAIEHLVPLVRSKFGETAAEITPMVLLLPTIVFLLTPLLLAEKKVRGFSLTCPNCSADLTQQIARVLLTRCCKNCCERVVDEGRARKQEFFDRCIQRRSRRFLVYWFWLWPTIGSTGLVVFWFYPPTFGGYVLTLLILGIIGTIAVLWAFVRTLDKRYIPQLVVSVVLAFITGCLFWNVLWRV